MCSFYFYYTYFSPVCQGADRRFFGFAVLRQYRTKSVWRLCTPSACKFPFRACFVSSRTHLACIFSEIFRENTRKSTKDFLRFSLHLSKNLTTQSAYVRYETDSHISQKCLWIHQVFTPLFVSSDEKFDDASVAQSLCGIALFNRTGERSPVLFLFYFFLWKFRGNAGQIQGSVL